jgi:hypothetical protein
VRALSELPNVLVEGTSPSVSSASGVGEEVEEAPKEMKFIEYCKF